MADVFTAAKRSEVMSKIRGSGNRSTELKAIALFRQGEIHGWRRGKPLPGRPDFCFPVQRLAVFIDGCFWHGCPRHYREPGSNVIFWRSKIARNRSRDREVTRLLRKSGWRVIRFWEHDLRGTRARAGAISRLMKALSLGR